MSDATLSAQRKTTIEWRLTATIPATGEPYDLSAAGQTVVLSVRRNRTDQDALITKTFNSGDPTAEPGLLIPDGAGNTNLMDVKLFPADTDPAGYDDGSFADTEFLLWDAILTNGDEVTVLADGALTVRPGAGS